MLICYLALVFELGKGTIQEDGVAYRKGGDVSDDGRGDRIGTSPYWVAEEKSVERSA